MSCSKSRPKSSCAASGTAGSRLGDDAAVAVWGRCFVGSRSGATLGSLSLTCRMVSDSRRISVSTGCDSSVRAALTRAKPLVFGNRLPRLVTARRITPGVPGAAPDPSSPLSFPLERFNPSVPRARLSRLLRVALFQPKYPPPADSILRIGGGECARGEAIELYPLLLALLECFLDLLVPLPWSRERRIVFMRLCAAGEKVGPLVQVEPPGVKGPLNGVDAVGF